MPSKFKPTNKKSVKDPLQFSTTAEIKVPAALIDNIIGQENAVRIVKKVAKQRRHLLLIGQPGVGKCVGKSTLIPTTIGEMKAKNLYKLLSTKSKKIKKADGTYLLGIKDALSAYSINRAGKIAKAQIINAYKSSKRKTCIKIKTRLGSEIILSGNHPLLTTDNGDLIFKKASEIKVGTKIGVARHIPPGEEEKIKESSKNERIKHEKGLIQYRGANNINSLFLKLPEKINEELAYFMGVYVAEGDYSTGVRISNSNNKINSKLKEIALRNFNYPEQQIKIDAEGITFKRARTLVYILEEIFDQRLWDDKRGKFVLKQSRKKRIPKVILNSKQEIIWAFLSGYIDGDGSFSQHYFQASSSSKNLIKDLKRAFLKVGVTSRYSQKLKRAVNTPLKKKRRYSFLTITATNNLEKLNKNLKLLIEYKAKRLEELSLKKKNTNVDLIYGVSPVLKIIKENLKIDYKQYRISDAAFGRYIAGKQNPSRDYIKRLCSNLSKNIRELKLKRSILYSYKDYLNTIISTTSHFNPAVYEDSDKISKRTFLRYIKNESNPSLNTICLLKNTPNNALQIYHELKDTAERINTPLETHIFTENIRTGNIMKLGKAYNAMLLAIEEKISSLENIHPKLKVLSEGDIFWDTIEKIESVEEETYDFEIEDTHNFITGEGIIVHNSLIGQALAELLPKEKLLDILSYDNPQDENVPIIKTTKKGLGQKLVQKARIQSMSSLKNQNIIFFILVIIAMITPWYIRKNYGDILAAASLLASMMFLGIFIIFISVNKRIRSPADRTAPKLLVDNATTETLFIDGTGAHSGALLGDCLHDPLQSGGLGTPPHERLIPGFIHRANGGVLFIDEVANLSRKSQQELLTALQEKRYPITGQSERSSGAMTRSQPAPTDFILIASGNPETIMHMHPALRSRIRGYGYEVFMDPDMPDNQENQMKLAQFIAQEVKKDAKIPHFSKEAALTIIEEARKRSGKAGKLTLRLRELGGLIRASGDIALEEQSQYVLPTHIQKAKKIALTLEQQIADKYIEQKKDYQVITIKGTQIGKVNGLAVMGSDNYYSGIVLPIESEITHGGKKSEFIATGQLGKIAKEAVKNVSAIILKYFHDDLEKYDVYVQFIGTPEGVEGDSASIAVATAIISALKKLPIRQDTAMTGSLSVRGEVLAVGGVTSKIEAAIEAGISRVIIPEANLRDVILSAEDKAKIKIIPVKTIQEVLKEALDWKGKESILKSLK